MKPRRSPSPLLAPVSNMFRFIGPLGASLLLAGCMSTSDGSGGTPPAETDDALASSFPSFPSGNVSPPPSPTPSPPDDSVATGGSGSPASGEPNGSGNSSASHPPTGAPEPSTSGSEQPPGTEPPGTEPPDTAPPGTEPPGTEPPGTELPSTELPSTEPPSTEPPSTDPPGTEPPGTEPPGTEPPSTELPSTEPPSTEPPSTELQRPEPFTATAGTREDGVLLEWGAVPGVVGYRVLRDDVAIAVVEAEVTTYLDTTAPTAPAPQAPQGVAATREAATLTVSWEAVPPPEAPSGDYRVVPLFEERDGPASVRRLGRRGSSPVTYEVRIAGQDAWRPVGEQLTWEDESLGPGTVSVGLPIVGRGSDREGVPLDVEWLRFAPGPERTYTVRAVTASGASAPGPSATGRRVLAEEDLVFAWERVSAPGQAQPVRPPALASRAALDRDAPADGARAVYRLVVTEPGGFSQVSLSAPGYRGWGDCIDRATFRGQPRGLTTGESPDFGSGIAAVLARVDALGLEDGDTATFQPPVQITGALVTAIERFSDGRFRVADADAVLRVQLEEGHRLGPEQEVEVGQRLSFAVTHVGLASGHLQVRRLSGFERVGEEHGVRVVRASGEPLHPDDVDLNVRVAGQIVEEVGPCGARFTCYRLAHGPYGATASIVVRSDRDDVGVGTCITWVGPLGQFPGPYSGAPTPGTLQLDGLDWSWYWRSPPGED